MQLNNYDFESLQIVDISSFIDNTSLEQKQKTADLIRKICKQSGFFYLQGHGVSQKLQQDIIQLSSQFFKKPSIQKNQIHMRLGGKAWRGYFSTGQELTSGKIDYKEGIYFGQELDNQHHQVIKGTPLHGQSQFPKSPQRLKEIVLQWIQVMQNLGQKLMQAIALSLRLPATYFKQGICKDPLCLFRIFNYHKGPQNQQSWGVGEHTDYGLLTILMVTTAGLQIKNRQNKWIQAKSFPNTFVINIGDMLERMTRGLYRSTPHRVKMEFDCERLSFPFFFDPGWNEKIEELKIDVSEDEKVLIEQQALQQRWDNQNLSTMEGTYGDYLQRKVSLVFPDLAKGNLKKDAMMM